MGNLCAKLVIVAGFVLLPIALIRSGAAMWQFVEILQHGSVGWTYYIWTPTSLLQDWLVAIALILIGFALSSKSDK